MRLQGYSENVPKPLVKIGYRPILWHIMKYYAYYGHKDFILCLGYKADVIKKYFLEYDEYITNDFTIKNGNTIELFDSDIHDWQITFVDTGLHSCVGERLYAVRHLLKDEEMFLANYADGVTDLPLPDMVDFFRERDKTASFVGVEPNSTFHTVSADEDGVVRDISVATQSGMRINGGFFVFTNEIFEHMKEGEELVEEPFTRLIEKEELITYKYDGFWACMDTFKEKQLLEDIHQKGNAPWEVWKGSTSKTHQYEEEELREVIDKVDL